MYKQFNQQLPTEIRNWLIDRGISNEVINRNYLGWNGKAITIPVFNDEGEFVFFKFRKSPNDQTEGPKYWYEKGNEAMLYNAQHLGTSKGIVICEGEFDCLALSSQGMTAVSSTGGAGTFPEVWSSRLIGKQIFVCFDNDDAGRKGSIKLLKLMPWARLVRLPSDLGNHADVSDYLQKYSLFDFTELLNKSESYPFFRTAEGLSDLAMMYQESEKVFQQPMPWALNWISEAFLKHHASERERLEVKKKTNSKKFQGENDIDKAKSIQIIDLYPDQSKIKKRNWTRILVPCPFHNEKTGSLMINLERNDMHCFGCSVHGDAIEFYMKLHEVSFKQALNEMLQLKF